MECRLEGNTYHEEAEKPESFAICIFLFYCCRIKPLSSGLGCVPSVQCDRKTIVSYLFGLSVVLFGILSFYIYTSLESMLACSGTISVGRLITKLPLYKVNFNHIHQILMKTVEWESDLSFTE